MATKKILFLFKRVPDDARGQLGVGPGEPGLLGAPPRGNEVQ